MGRNKMNAFQSVNDAGRSSRNQLIRKFAMRAGDIALGALTSAFIILVGIIACARIFDSEGVERGMATITVVFFASPIILLIWIAIQIAWRRSTIAKKWILIFGVVSFVGSVFLYINPKTEPNKSPQTTRAFGPRV